MSAFVRNSLYFSSHNSIGHFRLGRKSLILANRIVTGDLCGASDRATSIALAWCARFLFTSDESEKAKKYLDIAKSLSYDASVQIAEAYISPCNSTGQVVFDSVVHNQSPASLSSALQLLNLQKNATQALKWIESTGISSHHLDPFGKFVLLNARFAAGHWGKALKTAIQIDSIDYETLPSLHHLVGLAHLASVVPHQHKALILHTVPLDLATYSIAADQEAAKSIRISARHFNLAASAARALNCPEEENSSTQYALWCELLDQSTRSQALDKLRMECSKTHIPLHLVNLALQFGIVINERDIEREIERQTALYGRVTEDAASARFSLAYCQNTPENFSAYIDTYFNTLSVHINSKYLRIIQIYVLAQNQKQSLAGVYFDRLKTSDIELSDVEDTYLQSLVQSSTDDQLILLEVKQYEESNSIDTLRSLVSRLTQNQSWSDLCRYGKLLFELTRARQDAERYAIALRNLNRTGDLLEFLNTQSYIVQSSWHLQLLFCWSLLHEGEVSEALQKFRELESRDNNEHYRELESLIAIGTGNWTSLLAFTEKELHSKANRTSQELLSAAKLADALESPHSKELVLALAEAGENDAEILAIANYLATRNGWEDDPRAVEWLQKACDLSKDGRPIMKLSWSDLISKWPKWNSDVANTYSMLECGQLPVFTAAMFLKVSVASLTLSRALVNREQPQAHRRVSIPVYSGNRQFRPLLVRGVVGLDLTSLYVMEHLGLLRIVFTSFKSVFLPHWVLGLLFEEKAASRFHQPSRISDARNLLDLYGQGYIERLSLTSVPDRELAADAGTEIASLIAEAQHVLHDDKTQRLVVRSGPVYNVTKLDHTTVDLTAHQSVLISCRTVVDKLRMLGCITTLEWDRAYSYLNTQESPWPNEPEILEGAELYLDGLSVWYLMRVGLLRKIHSAGFRIFVTRKMLSEAGSLAQQRNISYETCQSIDNVRAEIVRGIDSGVVRFVPRSELGDIDNEWQAFHPIASLLSMTAHCDGIVTDDRFINQKSYIEYDGHKTPIYSTIDLIEGLTANAFISKSQKFDVFTQLRRAGFLFVPITVDELVHHLSAVRGCNSTRAETAELRAIRENLILSRISNALQLPEEAVWLEQVFQVFVRALRKLWSLGRAAQDLEPWSNWIVNQLDMRGWAHRFDSVTALRLVKSNDVGYDRPLFLRPGGIIDDLANSYWKWMEEKVLRRIRERNPSRYQAIVDEHRSQIATIVKTQLRQLRQQFHDVSGLESVIVQTALDYSAPMIRESLYNDPRFASSYSTNVQILLLVDQNIRIRRDLLCDAARRMLAGESSVTVDDLGGVRWALLQEVARDGVPVLSLTGRGRRVSLPGFWSFSPDRGIRVRALERLSKELHLPKSITDTWRSRLSSGDLHNDEILLLLEELKDTPVSVSRLLTIELRKNAVHIQSLVPRSKRYYRRLVGQYQDSAELATYLSRCVPRFLKDSSTGPAKEQFLFSLLLSSHSEVTKKIAVADLSDQDLNDVLKQLAQTGDRLSQLGAVEACLSVVCDRSIIERSLLDLIEILQNDDAAARSSGFRLQSSLFILVDQQISKSGVLGNVPPFYRRLASFAHSSLIYRAMIQSSIDLSSFCDFVDEEFSALFHLQSLVDMRVEPRWDPTFVSPVYLRSECLSRLVSSAASYSSEIKGSKVYDRILGGQASSIASQMEFPSWYFAGPLEGSVEMPNDLPTGVVTTIQDQLGNRDVRPEDFAALINSVYLGRIDSSLSTLAAQALERGRYRLRAVQNKQQLLSVLYGLSRVAAVTRNLNLLDSIRMTSRIYRLDQELSLSVDEEFEIIMRAGAGILELSGWCNFVGGWITELALRDCEDSHEGLYQSLHVLTHVVPELWSTCAAADAALSAKQGPRWD